MTLKHYLKRWIGIVLLVSIFFLIFLLTALTVFCRNSPPVQVKQPLRNLHVDNWVATDALGRKLHHAVAFERAARLVENDHVAGADFRPVQALRVDQVAVGRDLQREMVAHAFVEAEPRGPSQRARQRPPGA